MKVVQIPFQNTYSKLPERFFVRQAPDGFAEPKLIKWNAELARELRIEIDDDEALEVFSGNRVAEGSEPLAQAYAGHQFGGFSPQLGDGRALLLGEVAGRDIQLKGPGPTAFSRRGDGKSALGPVLREYIVSEAMHALGVPTTRALAAIATGEAVFRQEGMVPGGVFTRVAASHVRVGTFEYFAARRDEEALRVLADYVIARHYPEAAKEDEPFVALLENVLRAQARLVAQWMSLGFIHGVMNTDNMAVSGETIDYGPCAFMEDFHPTCVFSSIDSQRRYAWGNQPEMALWNLTRFAETLLPLIDAELAVAKEKAEAVLGRFETIFSEEYDRRFRAKFGLTEGADPGLIERAFQILENQKVDYTLFFRELSWGDAAAVERLFREPEAIQKWLTDWKQATPDQETMRQTNPVIIPRNHRIEQAIQAAYKGDYAPFHRLTEALARPFEIREEFSDLESLPKPEEIVARTFCGT